MDHEIEAIQKKLGVSRQKAKKIHKSIKSFMTMCEEQLAENPFDRTIEETTESDILVMRTLLAESGVEYTPQEVKDGIELLKYAREMIRGY